MKVAFDTNVLVSALVFPDELLGVLARKFARDAEELARVALFLADIGTVVQPRMRPRVRVLSLADYLRSEIGL